MRKVSFMKIVISGFYGAGNLGDESILSSIKKQPPYAAFTGLSLNPIETYKLYSVDAVFRPDFNPKWLQANFKIICNAMKNSDLVIKEILNFLVYQIYKLLSLNILFLLEENDSNLTRSIKILLA